MAKQFILDRSQLVPVMEAVPTEKIPIYSSETAAIAALSNHNVGDILATRDATEADILSNLITKVAELEAGNVYSTSEVNTGKTWIDGKPIYRKVYVKTTHIGDYALIDTGIDSCVSVGGYTILSGEKNMMSSPLAGYLYINSNNELKLSRGGGVDGAYIVYEYTKTTD